MLINTIDESELGHSKWRIGSISPDSVGMANVNMGGGQVRGGMWRWAIAMIAMALAITLIPSVSSAAPSVASVQREVDRLRTVAAEKYEAANEANIRIKALEKEMQILQGREVVLRKDLDAASTVIEKIARENYMSGGLGQSLSLVFSVDPSQYLSDASTLGFVSTNYARQLREFSTSKQRVDASQSVVSDKTALLIRERAVLNKEIAKAKSSLASAEKLLNTLKKEDRARLAKEESEREGRIFNASKKYASSFVGDNSRGSKALKYALAQIGDVYVWAAAGPTRWDCSGLTMRAFQKAGVSLPHSSRAQVRYGKNVSFNSVKPGDLVFFWKAN
uniref:NlpC/P60 family protein n=1 Tax=Candidatus Planktophila sp. TaxID=2175601 RepID=UPI00404B8335